MNEINEDIVSRKLRNKRIRTTAKVISLGRKLQEDFPDEIRYYFLAGDSLKEIATELNLSRKYGIDNELTHSALSLAVRGNRNATLGKRYRGLLNKKERKLVKERYKQEKQVRSKNRSRLKFSDIDELENGQMPLSTSDPAIDFDRKLLDETLEKVFLTLTYRDAMIIKMHNDVFGSGKYTFDEIGDFLGITGSRVQQLDKRAFRKLCFPTRSKMLEGFVDHETPNYPISQRQRGKDHIDLASYSRSEYLEMSEDERAAIL